MYTWQRIAADNLLKADLICYRSLQFSCTSMHVTRRTACGKDFARVAVRANLFG
jgi:hypothetical protein